MGDCCSLSHCSPRAKIRIFLIMQMFLASFFRKHDIKRGAHEVFQQQSTKEFYIGWLWLGHRNSYEKMRQILVSFSVQSRKEMCKESLLSCFDSLTFSWWICQLWLLRVSYVANEPLTWGIWHAHLPQVRASKHSSDNPKASFWLAWKM